MNPVGWFACFLVFVSMWLTGNKKRLGFLIGVAAELFWVLYAYQLQAFELGVMSFVFSGVYLRNYYQWRPEKPTTPT